MVCCDCASDGGTAGFDGFDGFGGGAVFEYDAEAGEVVVEGEESGEEGGFGV